MLKKIKWNNLILYPVQLSEKEKNKMNVSFCLFRCSQTLFWHGQR